MATESSVLTWEIPWTDAVHGGHKESGMTERLSFSLLIDISYKFSVNSMAELKRSGD